MTVPAHQPRATRAPVIRALIVAALILAAAAAMALLSPEHLDPGASRRLLGALLGFVVAVYANAVPKALSPLIETRCSLARQQAVRRFVGWALVLGGLAYAAVWLVAPLDSANLIAGSLLGASLLAAVIRVVLARRGAPGSAAR